MLEKLTKQLVTGSIFSIIPLIYIGVAARIGIDNFFKLVFVIEVGIVLMLAQGKLVEKFKK